ncbi:hypothetical protein FH608_039640 [Nonomuraea phyllanthi]|uniref:Uncharacterized protein n=1 Tax=Nonomuraea phyllanthi TaxID=2219224 RepID=A0A5C4VLS1_9ACTN|nr:hypothetical protein [Nonomuraea phyllanthi]KAB8189330.1 hypothetical protein FH608_039640 [Nonomuraea phyllanthi]
MTHEQPGREGPDPHETIRHRHPRPGPPPGRGPSRPPVTRRLPYTPDLLPDVPHYEAGPSRSGWWWLVVAGSIVLLVAAVAVAAILWSRAVDVPPPPPAGTSLTPG